LILETLLAGKLIAAKAAAAHTAYIHAGGAHGLATQVANMGVHSAINHVATGAAKAGVHVPLPTQLAQASATPHLTLTESVEAAGMLVATIVKPEVTKQVTSKARARISKALTAQMGRG
jgi:hypothetical protein